MGRKFGISGPFREFIRERKLMWIKSGLDVKNSQNIERK